MEYWKAEGQKNGGKIWRSMIHIGLLVIVMCVKTREALPITSDNGAVDYLKQFGYLPPSNPTSSGIITQETMVKAISDFQSFAGLNVTGFLDNETSSLMSMPRCGVKDKVGSSEGRSKRYALQGSRWRVKELTYKISKYPRKLDITSVDNEVAQAFAVWSQYTDLSFTQKRSGEVHIDIRFERGEHGDGDPFDGPGGTLAHAYFPVYGGDAHFDDSESWSVESYRGTNLLQVAAHEFGHSLGLSHSDVKAALMAPFYRGYVPNFMLHTDDIQGIQALYGSKSSTGYVGPGTNQRTTSAPPGEEDQTLCNDAKMDTMFSSAEGHHYVFKGEYYWKLTDTGIASGYPKLISSSWSGLPGNIDAAFTYKNRKTYFFKGTKYWRYVGKRKDGDYPQEISEGFTGIPDNIDAAVVWTGNNKIYFFKGTKFWMFDPTQRPPVKSTYPKLISNWEGIPNNLDAALVHRKHTYFFKGNAYYRFHDRTFSVDVDDPAFPRATAYWWFGCRSATRGTLGNVMWKNGYTNDDNYNSPYSFDNLKENDGALVGGDDNYHDDVGDIVLDAGDTDEQLVTSSNQDSANSGCDSIIISSRDRLWRLSIVIAILIVIITKSITRT